MTFFKKEAKILGSLPQRRSIFKHCGVRIADHFLHNDQSPHAKCGESILLNPGFPKGFSSVIGAHHGMPPENVKPYIPCGFPGLFPAYAGMILKTM